MTSQSEAGEPMRGRTKAFTLLGCGCLWVLIGGAVLAASSMFLVNPRLNGGAWLFGMFLVWLVIFGVTAWSILRSKEL